jgi:hypothetical protein
MRMGTKAPVVTLLACTGMAVVLCKMYRKRIIFLPS